MLSAGGTSQLSAVPTEADQLVCGATGQRCRPDWEEVEG